MNPENHKWIAVAFATIAALTLIAPPSRAGDEHAAKVKEAAAQSVKAGKAFDAIMQIPDKAIPRELLEHAKAIAVFPQVIKAAFVLSPNPSPSEIPQAMAMMFFIAPPKQTPLISELG